MIARFSSRFRAAALSLLMLPTLATATDEDADIEQAANTTSELIAYTRVLFDCDMLIESIEPSMIEGREMGFYFVTLKADGIECEQAFDVMNQRGRDKGLFFALPRNSETDGEDPGRMNFELIREIDPEAEG